MASFEPIANKTLTFEGGYQNDASDKANYCSNGFLAGTNHGISAIAYQGFLGHCPSQAEMKAITEKIAKNVYRTKFWDKMKGDKVKDQDVAHLMFDSIVGSYGYGFQHIRQAINQTAGKKVVSESTSPLITDDELNIINQMNSAKLFSNLKEIRKQYFVHITEVNDELKKYLNGWLNRVNKITYSGLDYAKNNPFKIVLAVGAVGLLTYLIVKKLS